MSERKDVLSTDEVCKEYGISSRTLLRLRAEGKIGGQRFGRQYKFLRRTIDAYIAGDQNAPPAAPAVWLPPVPRTMRRELPPVPNRYGKARRA